jgi:uncharacterized phage protein gp47/JayE
MAGFQLKDLISIAAAMINHAKASQDKLTDFEVGSVGRTLLEASAIEIEEGYQRIFFGILDGISTSVYKAFDFELQPAAAASGVVTPIFGGPIVDPFTIPQGTLFSAPGAGLKFASIADVAVPVGATSVDIVVSCTTPGSAGNLGAGTVTNTVGYTLPVGTSVTNAAMSGGSDGQTEAERKARFVESIQSLSRGPVASMVYAARQAQIVNSDGVLVEYVTRVGIDEDIGRVDVYLYGSAGVPSPALLLKVQALLDGSFDQATGAYTIGYRAGGVAANALPMSERAIPVALKVKMLPGFTGTQATKDAIATLLAGEFSAVESGGLLYIDKLTNAALTVAGVGEVLADNSSNEPCAAYEVLKLGAFSVEWI